MNQFKSLLRPLRLKMLWERVINVSLAAIAAGMAIVAALIFMSKFWYVQNLSVLAMIFMLSAMGFGLVYALSTRPTIRRAAAVGDALGYQERFVSAFELLENGQTSPLSELMIHDAMEKAKSAALHKKYKLKIRRNRLVCAAAMLPVLLLAGFTPAFQQEEIEQRQRLREMIDEEMIKLEEAANDAIPDAPEAEKKQLEAAVKRLLAEMRKAKTEGEAIQAIQKSQEELQKLSQQSVSKDLQALGESLAAHPATEKLGENLKNGKMDEIAADMEQLNDFMQNASEEELEALGQILAEAAETLADNPDLAQALYQASEIMMSGQYENIQNALSKLDGTLSSLASQNAGLREAIENLNAASAQAGQSIRQNQEKKSAGEGTSAYGGTSPKEDQTAGEASSTGEGPLAEQGTGSGGQPGSSPGGHTDNGDMPGGSGRGSGHMEGETIYRREAEAFADVEVRIDGQETDGPDRQQETSVMGTAGESVPYDQVVGQYKDEALKAIDDSEIPYGMKELVRDYFSALD